MLVSVRAVTASKLQSNEKPPFLKPVFKSSHQAWSTQEIHITRYQYKQPRVSNLSALL